MSVTVSALILGLYAAVCHFWRPTAFEVDGGGLQILWPLRVRTIPAREIAEAAVHSRGSAARSW